MAGGLPHPVLLSTALHLDEITIGGMPVEFKHVFYSWVAMAILFILGLMLRGRLRMVPDRFQSVFEVLVGGLENVAVSIVGEDARRVFPVLGGIFLFILTQNLLGLVPGCDAPTANVNTNAAMAIFVFLYYNYQGIKRWHAHYIGHFTGPVAFLTPLMLPIEIVSHLARPLSLTLRLFGNIRGEEIVLVIFFMMAPLISTIPIYFLFLLAKSLQAFIFFMLTAIYLKGAFEHAH